jgi:HAD superfamily hydrolase (TIGR01484 family)
MKPLALLDARAVRFVLVDIDDTLTTRGKLGAQAYDALEALQRAGKKVIPVTGRPAGWCDHIARMWPVEAVVGENGAFYFWFAEGKLAKRFLDDEPTRARQRRELQKLAKSILRRVPGAALASDQPYRETDLAIDYCEDVAPKRWSASSRSCAAPA